MHPASRLYYCCHQSPISVLVRERKALWGLCCFPSCSTSPPSLPPSHLQLTRGRCVATLSRVPATSLSTTSSNTTDTPIRQKNVRWKRIIVTIEYQNKKQIFLFFKVFYYYFHFKVNAMLLNNCLFARVFIFLFRILVLLGQTCLLILDIHSNLYVIRHILGAMPPESTVFLVHPLRHTMLPPRRVWQEWTVSSSSSYMCPFLATDNDHR